MTAAHLWEEIANLASELDDIEGFGRESRGGKAGEVEDVDALEPNEIRIFVLGSLHLGLELVHERPPEVSLKAVNGGHAENSLWVDLSGQKVVDWAAILGIPYG